MALAYGLLRQLIAPHPFFVRSQPLFCSGEYVRICFGSSYNIQSLKEDQQLFVTKVQRFYVQEVIQFLVCQLWDSRIFVMEAELFHCMLSHIIFRQTYRIMLCCVSYSATP
jgi:hypothetical protein